MRGKNPKRPPTKGDGKTLDIQEIFATIQGEGIYAGVPAIFIRLGGCNLACEFCDTEFESFKEVALENIISEVKNLSLNSKNNRSFNLVVITGGEPFRQPIEKLCEELVSNKFTVQIETNGTIFRDIPKEVEVICSPKNTGFIAPIRGDILERIKAFKFLISTTDKNYFFVPEVGQSKNNIPVFIQPMDEYDSQKNKENLERVIELAKENNYRVSLQTHKIMQIP